MREGIKIAHHVFEMAAKEYLSPHYIRVWLQGEGAQDFAGCTLGANNKIFVPAMDGESEPVRRTYTHRAIDAERNRIAIDFVDHGETGPASSWARNAKVGDKLGVAMKLVKKPLYPKADWYFLIGDATALPVISCILESLPREAQGYCVIEVSSDEDILSDVAHPGFTIRWIYNPHPEQGSRLPEEAESVALPAEGTPFAYIACEYRSVKRLRQYFRQELNWPAQALYAFSYWKAGEAEDTSTQSRQDEKNEK